MERIFLVEAKSFVFSVLDGASDCRWKKRGKIFPARDS